MQLSHGRVAATHLVFHDVTCFARTEHAQGSNREVREVDNEEHARHLHVLVSEGVHHDDEKVPAVGVLELLVDWLRNDFTKCV